MKILVIDDDPGLRKSLTMILKDAEYDVTTAASGEDGIRIAAAGTPDVILTDVRMPGMGDSNSSMPIEKRAATPSSW